MAGNNNQRTKHGTGRGGAGREQNNKKGNNPNAVNNRRNANRNNPSRRNNLNNGYDSDEENLEEQSSEESGDSSEAEKKKKEEEEKKKKSSGGIGNNKNPKGMLGGSTTSEESSSGDGKMNIRIPKAVKIKIAIAIIIIVLFLALLAVIAATVAAIFGGIDDTATLKSYKCETVNIISCRKESNNYELKEGERYCDDVLAEHGITRKNGSKRYIYSTTYSNVDFEKYVAGVADAEVGAVCSSCNNKEEVLKAFAVASRSAAQRINTGNGCYVESTDRFQVYVPPTSRGLEAAEATKGEVIVDKDGNVLSTEYDALACYDKKVDENGETWYFIKQPVLTGDKIPESWLKKANSSLFNNDRYSDWLICDGTLREHHGRGASQYGAYYMADVYNYDYKEIIYYYYEAYTDGSADKLQKAK